MIGIVDYGLGNVQAIMNIYRRLNIPAALASAPDDLARAERLILPGVGAFDWAMSRLEASGMLPGLHERVASGTPILGICVGMQMMAPCSDEGERPGLGWIDGAVRKFDFGAEPKVPLPHMGWNDVAPAGGHPLFAGLEQDAQFYFLHSYYFAPASADATLCTTDYGGRYASGVHAGHVLGVQFHPEKSHHWGIRLLKNFAEL